MTAASSIDVAVDDVVDTADEPKARGGAALPTAKLVDDVRLAIVDAGGEGSGAVAAGGGCSA